MSRTARIERETKESKVVVSVDLDGAGTTDVSTGVPFLASSTSPTRLATAPLFDPPGIRGDTASGGSKPATLETGAVVQVPLFLNEGDVVKVDTRSGDYLGRVSAAGLVSRGTSTYSATPARA